MHPSRLPSHPRALRGLPWLLGVAACLALLASCGPPPRPRAATAADLLDVPEARALELIREVAAERGVTLASAWSIDVGEAEPFEVDLRISGTRFGIEWVSPQDRADHASLLPAPNPRQLQVMPGAGADAEAQILTIDYSSYRYDPDLARVQRGSRGAREAESSVRTYVRDFFEYVRGQTGS